MRRLGAWIIAYAYNIDIVRTRCLRGLWVAIRQRSVSRCEVGGDAGAVWDSRLNQACVYVTTAVRFNRHLAQHCNVDRNAGIIRVIEIGKSNHPS